ncbi:MAG: tRNA pseudouridine(54/55) synthase Pus10 [Methanomicrobiales archaeon]|nr:tRNA pseudouridine(54/55) synthase Pus10 [Methanomicrobiales archaeon]
MELTELYQKISEYGEICDHCLGRMVAKRSFGLSNDQRGLGIRVSAALTLNIPFHPQQETCWICGDFFKTTDLWADRVIQAFRGIEGKTFVIGSKVPPLISESEEMVWSDLGLSDPEPLKSEINREVGKLVATKTGLAGDTKNPDLIALLHLHEERVEVQIRSLFLYGRYLKYERGIPQTHWACSKCKGTGCDACNGTGKQYLDSVEELIGRPLLPIFKAEKAILHGAGREDIDAIMVGSGRPFILEIMHPLTREADLKNLTEAINSVNKDRVEVIDLQWSQRSEVETLKNHKGHKKYRILVDIDGSIPETTLQSALEQLSGATIRQRTPTRVAHRRADKVRERGVLDIRYTGKEGNNFYLEVTGEAGLYIKELISGDQGRTTPSLTEVLKTPARVVQLDVIHVEGIDQVKSHGTS